MNKLIAIVGMCGSGKSVATEYFEKEGYKVIYFGGVTMQKLKEKNIEITEANEKAMREGLRKEYGMGAFAIILLSEIEKALKEGNVVLDGVYSWSELKILEDKFKNIKVLSIITDKSIRYERLSKREVRPLTNIEARNRDIAEIENLEKGGPISFADFYVCNNGTLDEYNKNLKNIKKQIEGEEHELKRFIHRLFCK